MRGFRVLGTVLLAASTASALSMSLAQSSAMAGPLATRADLSKAAPALTENVQYYRRHHHHDDAGAAVAGGIIGLAAGAIIGGAIAANAAEQQQRQQAVAYCAQRFRSYDPASGTYLARDGGRRPCP